MAVLVWFETKGEAVSDTLEELCPPGWTITTHCGFDAFCRESWTIYRSPKHGKGWILVLILKGESVPTYSQWYATPAQAAKYADR